MLQVLGDLGGVDAKGREAVAAEGEHELDTRHASQARGRPGRDTILLVEFECQ